MLASSLPIDLLHLFWPVKVAPDCQVGVCDLGSTHRTIPNCSATRATFRGTKDNKAARRSSRVFVDLTVARLPVRVRKLDCTVQSLTRGWRDELSRHAM